VLFNKVADRTLSQSSQILKIIVKNLKDAKSIIFNFDE